MYPPTFVPILACSVWGPSPEEVHQKASGCSKIWVEWINGIVDTNFYILPIFQHQLWIENVPQYRHKQSTMEPFWRENVPQYRHKQSTTEPFWRENVPQYRHKQSTTEPFWISVLKWLADYFSGVACGARLLMWCNNACDPWAVLFLHVCIGRCLLNLLNVKIAYIITTVAFM